MSLFGPSTPSLGNNPQQQPSNTFGTSRSPFPVFGGPTPAQIDAITQQQALSAASQNLVNTLTPEQQGSSLFGKPQQEQSSSIFGGLGGPQQQPPQGTGIFGGLNASTQQQQTNSIFGGLGAPQQQSQQGTGIFGGLGAGTQQQQTSSIFGGIGGPQQQSQQGTGIFGGLNAGPQQQPQQQQQGSIYLGPQQGGVPQSRLWPQADVILRPKSVTDQMELALAKWNPQSPITLFQTYLYNTVNPDQVPFYRPSIHDDEAKWEEALRNKPTPGSVPVIVKGFFQLGQRLLLQERHLTILQGRLHEINDGLTNLLRKHDLEISVRAAECKRKHLRISHQCVKLAAKVQVLRNRGYAMDSAEEELREKLLKLERSVFDPALNGRAEEIWARMVSVRERGRLLQREVERAGQTVSDEVGGAMDEEVMKRAKKILEGYGSQLAHLTKEVQQIQKEFAEWEESITTTTGVRHKIEA